MLTASFRLLDRALDLLFPPRHSERLLSATSEASFRALVRPITRGSTEALIPYDTPSVTALIWELKYYGSAYAIHIGGALLAEHLSGLIGEECIEQPYIIPIPLYRDRLKERGYNQAERLAREVTRLLDGASFQPNALSRLRKTVRQTALPKAKRLSNVHGAFGAHPELVSGRTFILIDDVVTTGATMQSAADALREAGALKVFPVALAYAE